VSNDFFYLQHFSNLIMISSLKNNKYLPVPFNSVGGHDGFLEIQEEDKKLMLKPCLDERGEREVLFYSKVYKEKFPISLGGAAANPISTSLSLSSSLSSSSSFNNLCDFLPRYYGKVTLANLDNPSKTQCYLVLENLEELFTKPSVMDVKIGLRTYGSTATSTKITAEEKKYPLQKSIGYRIVGMKVWDGNLYRQHGRSFGLSLIDPETVYKGFIEFLIGSKNLVRIDIAIQLLERLYAIKKWFNIQKEFCFYGSSLLFIYEGDENKVPKVDVRLIDFAHAESSNGSIDEGFLVGLENICNALEKIIKL
jgi:inositol-polyphosphate multikinase